MQIHELNTFSGTPGDIDFLATDNGTDTSKISAINLLKGPNDKITDLQSKKVNQPLDAYNQPTNGTNGQLLRTKGDGKTEWVNEGLPTDAQTAQAVSDWLDDHPEATTTVADGSLTEAKFSSALQKKAIKDYITPQMFGAAADGVTDDSTAFQDAVDYCISNELTLIIPNGKYLINSSITVVGLINIYGADSTIEYTGNGSAFVISKYDNGFVNFGIIKAPNGNCIELFGTSGTTYVQYLNLSWREFWASDKCIYCRANSGSWVNEIRFNNGRFISGNYGIYADAENRGNLSGYYFFNIGIEGVNIGLYLANELNAVWKIINARYAEASTVLKTVGTVGFVEIYASSILGDVVLDLSSGTSNSIIVGRVATGESYRYAGYFNIIMSGRIYSLFEPINNTNNEKNLGNVATFDMTQLSTLEYYNRFGFGGVDTVLTLSSAYETFRDLSWFYVYDSSGGKTITINRPDGTQIYSGIPGYNKTLRFEFDGKKWHYTTLAN